MEVDEFTLLTNLKNAGAAFEGIIQNSLELLESDYGYGRVKEYYPASVEAGSELDGWADYAQMVEEAEVPVEKYEAAVEKVGLAKADAIRFLKTTPGLKEYSEDPLFKTVFVRGLARFEGLPSLE